MRFDSEGTTSGEWGVASEPGRRVGFVGVAFDGHPPIHMVGKVNAHSSLPFTTVVAPSLELLNGVQDPLIGTLIVVRWGR